MQLSQEAEDRPTTHLTFTADPLCKALDIVITRSKEGGLEMWTPVGKPAPNSMSLTWQGVGGYCIKKQHTPLATEQVNSLINLTVKGDTITSQGIQKKTLTFLQQSLTEFGGYLKGSLASLTGGDIEAAWRDTIQEAASLPNPINIRVYNWATSTLTTLAAALGSDEPGEYFSTAHSGIPASMISDDLQITELCMMFGSPLEAKAAAIACLGLPMDLGGPQLIVKQWGKNSGEHIELMRQAIALAANRPGLTLEILRRMNEQELTGLYWPSLVSHFSTTHRQATQTRVQGLRGIMPPTMGAPQHIDALILEPEGSRRPPPQQANRHRKPQVSNLLALPNASLDILPHNKITNERHTDHCLPHPTTPTSTGPGQQVAQVAADDRKGERRSQVHNKDMMDTPHDLPNCTMQAHPVEEHLEYTHPNKYLKPNQHAPNNWHCPHTPWPNTGQQAVKGGNNGYAHPPARLSGSSPAYPLSYPAISKWYRWESNLQYLPNYTNNCYNWPQLHTSRIVPYPFRWSCTWFKVNTMCENMMGGDSDMWNSGMNTWTGLYCKKGNECQQWQDNCYNCSQLHASRTVPYPSGWGCTWCRLNMSGEDSYRRDNGVNTWNVLCCKKVNECQQRQSQGDLYHPIHWCLMYTWPTNDKHGWIPTHQLYHSKGGGMGICCTGGIVRLLCINQLTIDVPWYWKRAHLLAQLTQYLGRQNRSCHETSLTQDMQSTTNGQQQQHAHPHIQRGGKPANANTIYHNPLHEEMYHETQLLQFCQVHSINNLLGGPMLHPQELLEWADDTSLRAVRRGYPSFAAQGLYTPRVGNFSTLLVNAYIKNTNPTMGYLTPHSGQPYTPSYLANSRAMENYTNGLQHGSSKAQVIQACYPHTSCLLHFTKGSYGHAACLRKDGDEWFYHDSENPTPINLDMCEETQGWATLQGHMYILSKTTQPSLGPADLDGPAYQPITSPITIIDSPPPQELAHPSTKRHKRVIWSAESDQEEPHNTQKGTRSDNPGQRSNQAVPTKPTTDPWGHPAGEGLEAHSNVTHLEEERGLPKRSREMNQERQNTPRTRRAKNPDCDLGEEGQIKKKWRCHPKEESLETTKQTQITEQHIKHSDPSDSGPTDRHMSNNEEADTQTGHDTHGQFTLPTNNHTDAHNIQEHNWADNPMNGPPDLTDGDLTDSSQYSCDTSDSDRLETDTEDSVSEEEIHTPPHTRPLDTQTDQDIQDQIARHPNQRGATSTAMPKWWLWPGNWQGETAAAWDQKMKTCKQISQGNTLFEGNWNNQRRFEDRVYNHHTGLQLQMAMSDMRYMQKETPPIELLLLQYAHLMKVRVLTHIGSQHGKKKGEPTQHTWVAHWDPITLPEHIAEEWCDLLGLTETTKNQAEIDDNAPFIWTTPHTTITWEPTRMAEEDLRNLLGEGRLKRLTEGWNNRRAAPQPDTEAPPPSKKPKTYKQTLLTSLIPKKEADMGQTRATNPTTQENQPPSPPQADKNTEIITVNCRGIRSNWESIYTAIQELQKTPDVIIFTETKLTTNMRGMRAAISRDMGQYNMHHSSVPNPKHLDNRGRGGVIILTHTRLGPITKVEVQPNLAGALVHIRLNSPEYPTHIMGIYMPDEEPQTRLAVYEYIKDHTDEGSNYLITGGDWNATTYTRDRSTGVPSTLDNQHRKGIERAAIHPTNCNPNNRKHTFHCYQEQRLVHSSRIDDILIHPQPTRGTLVSEECMQAGGTLDHHILRQTLNTHITNQDPQPEKVGQTAPTLILPITQEYIALTRSAIRAQMSNMTELLQPIEEAYAEAMATLGGDLTPANLTAFKKQEANKVDMDSLTAGLMAVLRQNYSIMLEVCPKKPPLKGNFLTRAVGKDFRKKNSLAQQLKQIRQATAAQQPADLETIKNQLMQEVKHEEAIPTILQMPTEQSLLPQWRAELGEQIKETINRLDKIRKTQAKDRMSKSQVALSHRLAVEPKKVHRRFFNNTEDNGPQTITLRDVEGKLQSTTEGVLDTLTHHMKKLMSPANHIRTGKYLPGEREQANQQTPWENDTLDPVRLSTPAQAIQKKASLLNILMDKCTYLNCIRHLARNKQPGPDGIPNELLTCLPETTHNAIHKLLTLMWITGKTPQCLQESHTLSLYKKGDPTNPANYRPIGLSNTVSKLWTAMVSSTLAHFSEHTGILSSAQEGFRANKGTHRQLTNLIHIIEDAALTNQDLYIAYFDFSSAFNMVDHDKLLCIMYDLGYPTDSIEAVRSIYHGATTNMIVQGRTGPTISIERGTIQGDSLSPLLFLIFIEPLHRWLQSGGRGYRFGSIPTYQKDKCCTGSLGYADDTTAITHTAQDLQVQCNKVQTFSTWAGLPLNPSKCEITGILHKSRPTEPTCPATLRAHLNNHIKLGDAFAKYVPPTEACTYLGIKICPNMDWRPQVQHMMEKIQKRGEHIRNRAKPAGATPQQCLKLIRTCLIPQITYTMAVCPYTPADIARMDRAVGALTKQCCGLPKGFPSAAVRLPQDQAGLGMPSLQLDYVQTTTANLTRALNDQGTLGATTHALLQLQHKKLQGMDPTRLPRQAAQYLTIMRQMHILKKADVQLQKGDIPVAEELTKSISMLDELSPYPIPPGIIYPLHKLGITEHTQLINPEGTHLICTQELANTWATTRHPVTNVQKRALNRISLIISGKSQGDCWKSGPQKYMDVHPLPAECRKLPRAIGATPPNKKQPTIPELFARAAQPPTDTQKGKTQPINTPTPPEATAPKPTKLCPWWRWTEDAPGWKGDTPDAWTAKVTLCPTSFFNTQFATKHKLKQGCSGEQLKRAVQNSSAEIPPPQKLLVLTYAHHFHVEHLSSNRNTKDREGNWICRWATNWAPVTVQQQHAEACGRLFGFPLNRTVTQPGSPVSELHWDPLILNTVTIEEMIGDTAMHALVAKFNAQKATPTPPASRRDTHLTERQQQGCWQEDTGYQAEALRLARERIVLDPTDCHPDLDIAPTGQYHIQTGLLLPGKPLANTQVSYLYDPAGRCVGTLPITRLRQLYGAYLGAKARDPAQHKKLGGSTFERDLANLLMRQRPQARTRTAPLPTQTLSALLMATFKHMAMESTELFTTPLEHSAYHSEYCSEHDADQLFGARPAPYTRPWQGLSIANPMQDGKEIHKAMRWAIASAQGQPNIPTCTIMAVPRSQQQAYAALLTHRDTHVIDDIPGHIDPIQPQDNNMWTGGKLPPAPENNTHRHLLIIAITNEAGRTNILEPAYPTLQAAWRQATASLPGSQGARNPLPLANLMKTTSTTVHPPRDLRPLLQKGRKLQTFPTPPPAILPQQQQHYEIQQHAGRQIYTDGSETKQPQGPSLLGAGIYVVGHNSILINPGGIGSSRTNNRAELSAIHIALRETPADEHITLYTDSLGSIHNIRNMINTPHRMNEAIHREMLESIARLLMQRAQQGSNTRIQKVRSHSGIKGNDLADSIAKAAANNPRNCIPDPTAESARLNLIWPSITAPKQKGDKPDTNAPRTMASNLTQAIKKGAPTTAHIGSAKTDGIYAQNWAQTTPTLHKESSSHYWNMPLAWHLKMNLMKLRWGHFWSRKLAHRYGMKYANEPLPPTSCTCPICWQGTDGASHILAGCRHPNMTGAYINRHDEAVKILQRAISKGSMGNCTTFMDAGAAADLPADVQSKRLPDWLRPDTTTPTIWKKMRPDILILPTLTNGDTPTPGVKQTIHIVEVGYCSDTNHEVKLLAKAQQHQQLAEALRAAGHDVRMHLITLGTTGTIRQDTLNTVRDLGVEGDHAPRLLMKLHANAIHYVQSITAMRRHMERGDGQLG